jgi:diguanylate cyclase (GGDEF)-like protein
MRRFAIGRYLTAGGLGVYSLLFFDSMSMTELACTVVIMSALAGGASTVLSADRLLALSYSAIVVLPLSVVCIFADQNYQIMLGWLGLLFAGVMYMSAKRAADFTAKSLLIKNQHDDLVKELALKNDLISEANANLESKVKLRAKKIFELSNIDPLTKLFNRKAFSKSLKSLLTEAQRKDQVVALLFIDLDGFKGINDVHGHAIGDKVLKAISHRLMVEAQGHESICRWGGDEFLMALSNRSANEAKDIAKMMISLLSQPIRLEERNLNVGATVGVAMFPEHSVDVGELIELADTAMYAQKQTTKSDVCIFNEKMRQALNREVKLKDGLRQALAKNQMHLVYQPVINNGKNQVSFCEALLRWELEGEMVPPAEFVKIAEQNGLMHSIGSWVLRQACMEASQWQFGHSVSLSVNMSVPQLMHSNIVSIVKKALSDSGLPAQNLHIEITESIFVKDVQLAIARVKALQALNVKVSVDDFGTGFSSLSLLQSLSADIVKIDRSFVASIDSGGRAIIQATQYMAKELGYKLVVEGVETAEQQAQLQKMGIELLQGFYFAKPMRFEELPAWHQAFLAKINIRNSD